MSSSSSRHDQDWTQVVFKRTVAAGGGGGKRASSAACTQSLTSSKPAWKIEQNCENGEKLARIDRDVAKLIVAARVAKGLSQSQLANALNMQPRVIQDVESGKTIDNRDLLAKIKRYLNIS